MGLVALVSAACVSRTVPDCYEPGCYELQYETDADGVVSLPWVRPGELDGWATLLVTWRTGEPECGRPVDERPLIVGGTCSDVCEPRSNHVPIEIEIDGVLVDTDPGEWPRTEFLVADGVRSTLRTRCVHDKTGYGCYPNLHLSFTDCRGPLGYDLNCARGADPTFVGCESSPMID